MATGLPKSKKSMTPRAERREALDTRREHLDREHEILHRIHGALRFPATPGRPVTELRDAIDLLASWVGIDSTTGREAAFLEALRAARAPVVAVNDGVIRALGESEELGRYIVLEDAYGNRFTYAGLGSLMNVPPVPRRHEVLVRPSRSRLAHITHLHGCRSTPWAACR